MLAMAPRANVESIVKSLKDGEMVFPAEAKWLVGYNFVDEVN